MVVEGQACRREAVWGRGRPLGACADRGEQGNCSAHRNKPPCLRVPTGSGPPRPMAGGGGADLHLLWPKTQMETRPVALH